MSSQAVPHAPELPCPHTFLTPPAAEGEEEWGGLGDGGAADEEREVLGEGVAGAADVDGVGAALGMRRGGRAGGL
jgi:hypothetical protein